MPDRHEISVKTIPEYLETLLSDQSTELFKEQVRQKEYSKSLPLRQGERHAFIPWSGGLDSTASLLMALDSGIRVTSVNFNYGQDYYGKELKRIKLIIKEITERSSAKNWLKHVSVDISWLDIVMKSRFDGEWGHIFPVRNYILLYETMKIAINEDYPEIWFSAIEGEIGFSGGDKSRVFITETQREFIKHDVALVTPLIGMNKSDIVKWSKESEGRYIPIRNSISCFSGESTDHCGSCMSCFNRATAFYSAGVIEDVGFIPNREDFGHWIEYYKERVEGDNPYSEIKKKDILNFIDSL